MEGRRLLLLPAVVLGLLALDAVQKHATWVERSLEVSIGLPGDLAPRSAPQQRVLRGSDGYRWLDLAQTMQAQDLWRVRRESADAAPGDREQHWSSSVAWLVQGLSNGVEPIADEPPGERLLRGGLLLHPILFAVLIVGVSLSMGARLRDSSRAAVLSLALLYPLAERDFLYGGLDHHGLLDLVLSGSLLSLLHGARRSGSRWPWLISALLGATALWVQGPVSYALLVATAVGAAWAWAGSETPEGFRSGVRLWGLCGAALALAFYALEYIPQHAAMRLEANHPLYALGWLALAEALVAQSEGRLRRALLIASVAAIPLALIAVGPVEWFSLRDPLMQRLHAQIGEFQPLWVTLRAHLTPQGILGWVGLAPLILAIACGIALASTSVPGPRLRGQLRLTLCPTLAAWALALVFTRWLGLALALTMISAIVFFEIAERVSPKPSAAARALATAAIAVAFLQALPFFEVIVQPLRTAASREIDPALARRIFARDFVPQIALASSRPTPVVLGPLDWAPDLWRFGGVRSVGSLVWENRDAVRDVVEWLATDSDDIAGEIAAQRGFDLVVISDSPAEVASWTRLRDGRVSERPVRDSLAYRLLRGEGPEWIARVAIHDSPMKPSRSFHVFSVDAEALKRSRGVPVPGRPGRTDPH